MLWFHKHLYHKRTTTSESIMHIRHITHCLLLVIINECRTIQNYPWKGMNREPRVPDVNCQNRFLSVINSNSLVACHPFLLYFKMVGQTHSHLVNCLLISISLEVYAIHKLIPLCGNKNISSEYLFQKPLHFQYCDGNNVVTMFH